MQMYTNLPPLSCYVHKPDKAELLSLYPRVRTLKMTTAVSIAILAAVLAVCWGDHPIDDGGLHANYSFSTILNHDPSYVLQWSVDLSKEEVSFAVNVSSQGWVGFGLSRNGQMIGSDVVTAWITDRGQPQLQVRDSRIV